LDDGYFRRKRILFGLLGFLIGRAAFAEERRSDTLVLAYASPALYFDSIVNTEIPQAVPRREMPQPSPTAPPLFYIYADQTSAGNHFAPSGWMGDTDDLTMDQGSTDHPEEGRTCIKIRYSAVGSKNYQWAGIFWQERFNEWAGRPSGYDLSGMKRLTFWARGERGGEVISQFKIGGVIGTHRDSGSAQLGPVTLGRQWKRYAIDLSKADLSRIVGGFSFVTAFVDNPSGATFYLDDIRFEQ
jgi:hypothetical protein